MLTAKFMRGFKTVIVEAESFTVLHQRGGLNENAPQWAEVTIHHPSGDRRFDIGESPHADDDIGPHKFERCYIENASGKTIEHIDYGRLPVAA